MQVNIGNIDRVVRLVIGVVAIAAVFIGPLSGGGWPTVVAGAVGVIMIATSAIKLCPLYRIFGMRTCPVD